MMRRPEWLTWGAKPREPDGSITPAQPQTILESSPAEHDQQFTSRTLVWLAWLVAGFGLILLVAWNWTMISGRFRIGGAAVVALTSYGTAWLASRRGADRLAELLAFAGALAVGANGPSNAAIRQPPPIGKPSIRNRPASSTAAVRTVR